VAPSRGFQFRVRVEGKAPKTMELTTGALVEFPAHTPGIVCLIECGRGHPHQRGYRPNTQSLYYFVYSPFRSISPARGFTFGTQHCLDSVD
jgi:hypothetical protein